MKVTFGGSDKRIVVNYGIIELDVQIDLYSDWKEWLSTEDNAKFPPAMRTIGGDPTVGVKSVAPYFFLMNGWKVRPYEGNHTLNISGNLFVDEPGTYGYNIIVSTIGTYRVLVNMSTTSDATVITAGSGWTTEEKNTLLDNVYMIKQINSGCWYITNNQMIFYKDDNETEIMRFDLLNKDGKPAMIDVFKRDRV